MDPTTTVDTSVIVAIVGAVVGTASLFAILYALLQGRLQQNRFLATFITLIAFLLITFPFWQAAFLGRGQDTGTLVEVKEPESSMPGMNTAGAGLAMEVRGRGSAVDERRLSLQEFEMLQAVSDARDELTIARAQIARLTASLEEARVARGDGRQGPFARRRGLEVLIPEGYARPVPRRRRIRLPENPEFATLSRPDVIARETDDPRAPKRRGFSAAADHHPAEALRPPILVPSGHALALPPNADLLVAGDYGQPKKKNADILVPGRHESARPEFLVPSADEPPMPRRRQARALDRPVFVMAEKEEDIEMIREGSLILEAKMSRRMPLTVDEYDLVEIARAEANGSDSPEALSLLAWDLIHQGRLKDAVQTASTAIEKSPDDAHAYFVRGFSQNVLEQYYQALEDFTSAIELDPNFIKAYIHRGATYDDMKQFDNALQDLNKAIRLDLDNAYAYNSRGITYSHLRDFDKGIENFTKAIRLDLNYADAYHNRAITYKQLGEKEKAWADRLRYEELTQPALN